MTVKRLFATLFIIAIFVMGIRETLDPDMWWHLRTGEHILREGLPDQDLFSFTVPEHNWITHEWLSQLSMWSLYQMLGLPGLIIAFSLLITVTFWLLYRCSPGKPYLSAFVSLLAALTSAVVWGVRPQIFNLLFTAAFVYIVERVKDRTLDGKALWLLPFLTLLWANFHSGYLLGIVLLSTYVTGEALQRLSRSKDERNLTWPLIRRLALAAAAGLLLAAVNPNGFELWIYPFLTLGSPAMQSAILEWRSPDFHQAYIWPFAAMMAIGVTSLIFSARRTTWTEFLLFVGTAAAGLLSARHIPLFAVVTAPTISRHLLSMIEGTSAASLFSGGKETLPVSRLFAVLNWSIVVVALIAAATWTATKINNNEQVIAQNYPVSAVDFLYENNLDEARGFNSYNWGGYLIWRKLPVFIDGRADVYGDDFLFYYLQTYNLGSDWQAPLDDFDVEYILMERNSPLTNLLDVHDNWEEIYADEIAQIFVRSGFTP